MRFTKALTGLAGVLALTVAAGGQAQADDDLRIAMVVKSLGNNFFEAARDGGQEAADELGNVEIIYTGPTSPTAEGQIETINALIAQQVDAIVVSANDPDALVPTTRRAMQRGIPVISFDSGISEDGRMMHLNPSNNALIGRKQIEMISETLGGEGEIAILSATAQATNQNIWIEEMRAVLEEDDFSGLNLVDVVYGDDQSDRSYREAVGLIRTHENLRGIIAPTTVGITAAAQAVADEELIGEIFVTGLGLPSEMAGHVDSGAVESFAIWNPIDLGYTAVHLGYQFATGGFEGMEGEEIPAGRMGSITIGENGEAAMSEPFEYNADNVHDFVDIF